MQIFWINIDKLRYKDFFEDIIKFDKYRIVFTPNPEMLLKVKNDDEFRNILNKADYLTSDGIGLYIAFQIKTSPLAPLLQGEGNIRYFLLVILNIFLLPYYFFNLFFRRSYLYEKYGDRICWSDLTADLLTYSQKNKIKITVIDPSYPEDKAKTDSQNSFRVNLSKKFPNLDFDFFVYSEEKKGEIMEKIASSNSKILFSTLGMKTQEKSVLDIMDKCKNIKLWLWVGSSFDYFIWFQKRAPKLWSNLWLEWLYRLIFWRRRIYRLKRLWNAIFVFTWEVLKSN